MYGLYRLAARFSAWWFSFTVPPFPPERASLRQHELARRARITSIVILLTIVLLLTTFAVHSSAPPLMYPVLIVVLTIDVIALVLNRKARILLAGYFVTGITQIGLCGDFLGQIQLHHGLDLAMMPLFGMLVQPILMAVSLLPARAVVAFTAFNCGFVVFCTTAFPHLPSLEQYIQVHGWVLLLQPPLLIFIMVACISYIWVHMTTEALKRADLAVAQAEFERQMRPQAVAKLNQEEEEHA